MSKVVDIAEALGVVAPALPAMVAARELMKNTRPAPPQIIHGVLHQTCKLLLSGTSKSMKSWSLLDLGASVGSGQEWWGHQCELADVAYLNFELPDWAMRDRLAAVLTARPECRGCEERLFFWNLRGHGTDLTVLLPKLGEQLCRRQFGLIIIDPIYKLLGDRDENSNGEIAGLMNGVEEFCQKFGAAVAIAHHFAKGDSTAKSAIDRMSGAGVWARDPDSLVTLTPHEEDDCFSVNMTLRNLPRMPEFVVRWEYPLMRVASDLNPEALRRPQGRNKKATEKEFLDAVISTEGRPFGRIMSEAKEVLDMSRATASRFLQRGVGAGLIHSAGGLYWKDGGSQGG